jgi:hypothetical protein
MPGTRTAAWDKAVLPNDLASLGSVGGSQEFLRTARRLDMSVGLPFVYFAYKVDAGRDRILYPPSHRTLRPGRPGRAGEGRRAFSLYRNIKDLGDDRRLQRRGCTKESVVLGPDSRSSEKFMHGIKVLMAKNYVDNLSEETRKGCSRRPSGAPTPTRWPSSSGASPADDPLPELGLVNVGAGVGAGRRPKTDGLVRRR